jgi:hypothetical protein
VVVCFSELGSEQAALDISVFHASDDEDDKDDTFIEKRVFKTPMNPPSSVSV